MYLTRFCRQYWESKPIKVFFLAQGLQIMSLIEISVFYPSYQVDSELSSLRRYGIYVKEKKKPSQA